MFEQLEKPLVECYRDIYRDIKIASITGKCRIVRLKQSMMDLILTKAADFHEQYAWQFTGMVGDKCVFWDTIAKNEYRTSGRGLDDGLVRTCHPDD